MLCSSPGTILALIEAASEAPKPAAATTNMIRKITIAIESAKGELASRFPMLLPELWLSTLNSVVWGTWDDLESNRSLANLEVYSETAGLSLKSLAKPRFG